MERQEVVCIRFILTGRRRGEGGEIVGEDEGGWCGGEAVDAYPGGVCAHYGRGVDIELKLKKQSEY